MVGRDGEESPPVFLPFLELLLVAPRLLERDRADEEEQLRIIGRLLHELAALLGGGIRIPHQV